MSKFISEKGQVLLKYLAGANFKPLFVIVYVRIKFLGISWNPLVLVNYGIIPYYRLIVLILGLGIGFEILVFSNRVL